MASHPADVLMLVISATLDAIRAFGSRGVVAGDLYAVLMSHGCTMNQYEGIVSVLVEAGKVRRDGNRIIATEGN